ncbi:hypothetical protein [Streptomyces sp. NPDC053079]|uniref:hypothetical protein n=1 Tax=Streptomyces sp. NPDC053079 TaxID=3365697 RepID=UPI0037D1891A
MTVPGKARLQLLAGQVTAGEVQGLVRQVVGVGAAVQGAAGAALLALVHAAVDAVGRPVPADLVGGDVAGLGDVDDFDAPVPGLLGDGGVQVLNVLADLRGPLEQRERLGTQGVGPAEPGAVGVREVA